MAKKSQSKSIEREESELVELSVSFSEKISENYNSHSYGGTWTVKLGKNDLEERTEEELTTFYLKRLRKIIKRNAGTVDYNISPQEMDEKAERATKRVQKEKTPEKESPKDMIYKVVIKRETDKAYLLQNENDLVKWVPKSQIKTLIERKDGSLNVKLTKQGAGWVPDKKWEAPS